MPTRWSRPFAIFSAVPLRIRAKRRSRSLGYDSLQLHGYGGEDEAWPASTTHDALNRITQLVVPISSTDVKQTDTVLPTYNEAGLLETVGVQFWGDDNATPFVTDIDYNEKGQRLKI